LPLLGFRIYAGRHDARSFDFLKITELIILHQNLFYHPPAKKQVDNSLYLLEAIAIIIYEVNHE